ncbi:hypothetical protein CEXT_499441 [Caerostris extrusa]|uniref:Uncharacterized protein n=1 Tax=Caerostris extrusa TaxID=172846 RepID=A0AAV4U127_CAEEX|nr:hypothetical protein CEXT_499441 [Caerostris extrusa]
MRCQCADSHDDRINDTKYDAFQNDALHVENQIKNHSNPHSTESPQSMGHLIFIDKILENYDKRAWPTYGKRNIQTYRQLGSSAPLGI